MMPATCVPCPKSSMSGSELSAVNVAWVTSGSGSRFLWSLKCGWSPWIPESATAQTMPSPDAENEMSAASALTVLTDRVMSGPTSKSSQIR